jgi:uncharacterized repeat protein (TIGR01451 family)
MKLMKPLTRLLAGCATALVLAQVMPMSAAAAAVAQPDLIGTLTANPAIVQPGAASAWSVVVTNAGNADAGPFQVVFPGSDLIWSGTAFTGTGTGWSCGSVAVGSRSPSTSLLCRGVGLAAGASTTVTIPITASQFAGPHSITGFIDSGLTVAESDETNNSLAGSYTVPVNGPFDFVPNHIAISDFNLVLPSEQVTFRTEVVNNGLYRGFTNQTITDTLPVGFTFVSYNAFLTQWDPFFGPPAGPVVCTPAGDPATGVVVTCTGMPNSSYAFTGGGLVDIVAQAPAATGLVDYIATDSVVVDVNNANIESNETNNTASATVHVTNMLPDLAVQMSTENPVTASGVINHTITITNTGTGVAPIARLQFSSLAGTWIGGGNATVTCGTLFTTRSSVVRGCNTSNLAPGASVTFPLQLQASGIASTTTTSGNVFVFGSRDVPPGADNFASTTATVAVGGSIDLSVTATATPATSAPGQPVVLNVNVQNNGTGLAAATTAQTTLPTGFAFTSGSTTAGACTAVAQVVSCPLAATSPGATQPYTVNTKASSVAGSFSATTVLDPANVVVESNETNNTVATAVAVSASFADLTTSVSGPATTPMNGKPTFAVTVSNIGNVAADPATVTIGETGFARLDSIVAPAGWTCTPLKNRTTGYSITCAAGPLAASGVATIQVTTAGALLRGVTTVTATADPLNTVQELSKTNNTSSTSITVI